MKTLIISYKIEKGKGSEDGSGYNNIVKIAESVDDLTLISRVNNIEKLQDDPAFKGVTLIGVDVPQWLSFYKKKSRGIILYYYLWQYFVARKVKELQANHQYDIIHQFNFHADWAPHFLKNPHGKLLWGPIAHHPYIRRPFLFHKPIQSFLRELVFWFVKLGFWLNPYLHGSIKRSDTILYANEDLAWPFRPLKDDLIYQNYAGSEIPAVKEKTLDDATFRCLFVGRFVDLKGPIVALRAFKKHVDATKTNDRPSKLTFVGKGPVLETLNKEIEELGLQDHCEIVHWIEQSALLDYYKNAHAFVYPSFEAQGLVVSEALSQGTPTITIQGTGPDFVAGDGGQSVPNYKTVEPMVDDYATAITNLYEALEKDTYQKHIQQALSSYNERLTWASISDRILALYKESLSQ